MAMLFAGENALPLRAEATGRVIFTDRTIGRPVVQALQLVRDDVLWLEDRYPANTRDQVWLAAAGRHGWLVITRDRRVRYRNYEKAAIREQGVGCFVLAERRDRSKWKLLKILVASLDEMIDRFEHTDRPFICLLDGGGACRRVL